MIPDDSLQQAMAHHRSGRLADAERLYREILRDSPGHPDALHLLGLVAAQAGAYDDALGLIEAAIRSNAGVSAYHGSLGDLAVRAGCMDRAETAYRSALCIDPRLYGALSSLGNLSTSRRRFDEAGRYYMRALTIAPQFAEAHFNFGILLEQRGDLEAAAGRYHEALRYRPAFPDALYNLGNLVDRLGDKAGARRAYEQALSLAPGFAKARGNLGIVLLDLGDPDAALGLIAAAPEMTPDLWDVRADVLTRLGRLGEAADAYRTAIGLQPPGTPRYIGGLWQLAKVTRDDPHLPAMAAWAADPSGLSDPDRLALHFALGKAHEDLGEPERALPHFLAGKKLIRAYVPYDEAGLLDQAARIRGVFSREFLGGREGLGDPSARPVFIVGMPRSGTTLIEQVLGSHPAAHAAGELPDLTLLSLSVQSADGTPLDFPEMAQALPEEGFAILAQRYLDVLRRKSADALRVTDKAPSNFRLAGLIHLMLPNAAIIHAVRDPVDTCLSCLTTRFSKDSQPFTNDIAELGRYWRNYRTTMAHWRDVLPEGRILDVRYEDMVDDLEGQARRMLAHVGLDWDPACLSFYKNRRPVLTASATQVRQPLYARSVGRSQAYRELLKPLLDVLGENS